MTAAAILAVIVGWTAFAFGGTYPSHLTAPGAALVALTVVSRPRVLGRSATPALDRWLLCVLGAMAIQLVPIPSTALAWLTPSNEHVLAGLRLSNAFGVRPVSIDAAATAGAALLYAGTIALFFSSREIFATGGVRRSARAVALIGLVLAAIGLAQEATGAGLMYWRWKPIHEGAPPFGPFVNRNYFATWVILAVPLVLGYLTAHTLSRPAPRRHVSWRRRVTAVMDGRAALLLASATLLIVALVATLSRSGMLGLIAALACGGELARRRAGGVLGRLARPAGLVVAVGVVAAGAALTRTGPTIVTDRVAATDVAIADRLTIWTETLPIAADFWLTGTGAGTFATAMAVYQQTNPGVLFNHAHNHYLQALTEGGVLMALPLALAIAAFVRAAAERLRADRSRMFWIRAGAASGLLGVAVQSVWDTGLTLPANAALAAVLAAIVLYAPPLTPNQSLNP